MKLKIDENMPAGLARMLTGMGHGADTVPSEGLAGSKDDVVFEAALNSGRFLITQDLDFSDVRKLAPGSHPGILLVRLRDPGRSALTRRVVQVLGTEDAEALYGCLCVLTDRKLRVNPT